MVPARVRGGLFACWSVTGLAALLLALSAKPCVAQTVQPAERRPAIAEKIAASQDLLDINTATAAQLRALPGMGDQYVVRVIAGRPYTAKNQLTMRGILPQSAYEAIKDRIIAHRPAK